METLVVSYFSVINVSLGWPFVALAPETESDKKPLEHSLTRGKELMESEEGGTKKKKKVRSKSRGEEKETVGVRRMEDHLQISSILERRRRG